MKTFKLTPYISFIESNSQRLNNNSRIINENNGRIINEKEVKANK